MRKGHHLTHIISDLMAALEIQDDCLDDNSYVADEKTIDFHLVECDIRAIEEHFARDEICPTLTNPTPHSLLISRAVPFSTNPSQQDLYQRPLTACRPKGTKNPGMEGVHFQRVKEAPGIRGKTIQETRFYRQHGGAKIGSGEESALPYLSASGAYHRTTLRSSVNRFRFANESVGSLTLQMDTPPGKTRFQSKWTLWSPIYRHYWASTSSIASAWHLASPTTSSPSATGSSAKTNTPYTSKNGEVQSGVLPAATLIYYVSARRNTLYTNVDTQIPPSVLPPSAENIYNLLKRSRQDDTTTDTKKILVDLTRPCDTCQRIFRGSTSFRISLGAEKVRFNKHTHGHHVHWTLAGATVHIVDDETHFSAATFFQDIRFETIWTSFFRFWVAIYTGLPNRLLLDQGSALGTSQYFTFIAAT